MPTNVTIPRLVLVIASGAMVLAQKRLAVTPQPNNDSSPTKRIRSGPSWPPMRSFGNACARFDRSLGNRTECRTGPWGYRAYPAAEL